MATTPRVEKNLNPLLTCWEYCGSGEKDPPAMFIIYLHQLGDQITLCKTCMSKILTGAGKIAQEVVDAKAKRQENGHA